VKSEVFLVSSCCEAHALPHRIVIVGSHPDLIPCDVLANGDFAKLERSPLTLANVSWSLGPRHIGGPSFDKFLRTADQSEREYFHLPGLIIKWYHIYTADFRNQIHVSKDKWRRLVFN
jgi:hypothetical protein